METTLLAYYFGKLAKLELLAAVFHCGETNCAMISEIKATNLSFQTRKEISQALRISNLLTGNCNLLYLCNAK